MCNFIISAAYTYRELRYNTHTGFDSDYEVIKKRDPLLTRLLTSGWLTLLSSSYKKAKTRFRVCLMSQLDTAWL